MNDNPTQSVGIAQKAKAMAQATADAAQKKLLKHRINKLLAQLGQSVFERRVEFSLPIQQANEVEKVGQQLRVLDNRKSVMLSANKPGTISRQSVSQSLD